jgi:hypothetical protein
MRLCCAYGDKNACLDLCLLHSPQTILEKEEERWQIA